MTAPSTLGPGVGAPVYHRDRWSSVTGNDCFFPKLRCRDQRGCRRHTFGNQTWRPVGSSLVDAGVAGLSVIKADRGVLNIHRGSIGVISRPHARDRPHAGFGAGCNVRWSTAPPFPPFAELFANVAVLMISCLFGQDGTSARRPTITGLVAPKDAELNESPASPPVALLRLNVELVTVTLPRVEPSPPLSAPLLVPFLTLPRLQPEPHSSRTWCC